MNNKNLHLITERQGMPLFLAGSINKGTFEYILNNKHLKLHSFLTEQRDIEKFFAQGHKVFVDSGAFTFWKVKRGLTKGASWVKNLTDEEYINNYIEWINKWENDIIFAAQLDSIPEGQSEEEIQQAADNTWNNYRYMIDKVNNPDIVLPVYHYGENISNLHRFIDFGCKYIAIGGLVGKSKKAKREFLDILFKEIKNSSNPNVMTHAFGMTSKDLLEEFPFTSCDSTSWMMPANNGFINTPWGSFSVSPKKIGDPKHIMSQDLEIIDNVEQYITERGFTFEMLEDYKQRQILSIYDTMEWCKKYEYKGIY